MSSFQVLVVLSWPETQHIDAPHGHHGWTVSLADGVTLTEVEQTVPGERLGVLIDEVWLLAHGEFTWRRTVPVAFWSAQTTSSFTSHENSRLRPRCATQYTYLIVVIVEQNLVVISDFMLIVFSRGLNTQNNNGNGYRKAKYSNVV